MHSYFSSTYLEAKRRFLEAAATANAQLSHYPINPNTPELSIDLAFLPNKGAIKKPSCLVISSGVHGVEGFLGSAVQLALLDQLDTLAKHSSNRPDILLIHGINPYGFHHRRRVNEHNVDLNRNFLEEGEFVGAPKGYKQLYHFLNHEKPAGRWSLFYFEALYNLLRFGLTKLKESVAPGQYEFPKGVFYGGRQQEASTQILMNEVYPQLQNYEHILHLDYHTGLGSFGDYKLLLTKCETPSSVHWYQQHFDPTRTESMLSEAKVGYRSTGLLGEWFQERLGVDRYRFATVEFGTYHAVRVAKALALENQAHHFGAINPARKEALSANLLERFYPDSDTWKRSCLTHGLDVIRQGLHSFDHQTSSEPVDQAASSAQLQP